jgi:hypothetical protein
MGVAARLQAHAGNWSNAYQILRRLHAYGATPATGFDPNEVATMAAVETALLECSQLGASEIVVGDGVPDNALSRIKPIEGVRLIRADAIDPGDGRRAFCGMGPAAGDAMRPQDFSYDMAPGMERFPLF